MGCMSQDCGILDYNRSETKHNLQVINGIPSSASHRKKKKKRTKDPGIKRQRQRHCQEQADG